MVNFLNSRFIENIQYRISSEKIYIIKYIEQQKIDRI